MVICPETFVDPKFAGTLRRNDEDRPLIKQNSSEAQKAQNSTFNGDNINIPAEVN